MKKILSLLILLLVTASASMAQRRITPVKAPDNTKVTNPADEAKRKKTESTIPASVIHYHDPDGNVILIDTLTGKEFVDSTAIADAEKVKGRIYPRLFAVTAGIDIWDPLMRCLGQHYGGASVWGELSLHNWIKPIVEIGFGGADNTPDGNNFTYRSAMAPFFKLGVNYNFYYNSNPDYQLLVGLRYGTSRFGYEISHADYTNSYWHENMVFTVPKQTTTAGYGELSLGVKVMVWRNISMGWTLKYHFLLHESATPYGKPWYIPGYGSRNGALTGGFSIMYTIPLSKNEPKGEETEPETTE